MQRPRVVLICMTSVVANLQEGHPNLKWPRVPKMKIRPWLEHYCML